ncbi:MAG: glycosyltransferase, partial [Alcaligenaceae bacterium]
LGSRFTPSLPVMRFPGELLFVGRLVEKKGLAHLIAVMPRIVSRFPNVRLTIAGSGPDQARLAEQITASGLEACVTFLGAVKQEYLPSLYRRAAIFVAPFVRAASGDQEGLPVALMEAIGCGCPVVAGNVAGIEDIFGEAIVDFAVDPADHEALAHRIETVLQDPDRAQIQIMHIRERMCERLDWGRVAERYASLLREASSLR